MDQNLNFFTFIMIADFFEGEGQIFQDPSDNVLIGTWFVVRIFLGEVQFGNILIDVVPGKDQTPVKRVNVKLHIFGFVG